MIHKFLRALITWRRSCKPLVPQRVIDIRYSYCRSCVYLKRSWWRRYCSACRCTINQIRWPLNKLAMPTEECPLLKWRKVDG